MTNPESLSESAGFVFGTRPLAPVRTSSDLRPILAAIAELEESAAQWARHAQVVARLTQPPVTLANAANTVADVYREAAHAVRAAVEEVRLGE